MIARAIRGEKPGVPYDIFDYGRLLAESRKAQKLEGIYHKGQRKIWDGKQVLSDLIAAHGTPTVADDRTREAIKTLFAVILWGELAAWKISADLATEIDDFEAKMAATSQAHDEARHFYVMHDYLELLDEAPMSVGPLTNKVLAGTLNADSLIKKLMGMQMMIEPMALTLFQIVRKQGFEPVLSELLVLYERDEARHVALGVMYLPRMLSKLSKRQLVSLYTWQMRQYFDQFAMLGELQPHFEALGVPVHDVIDVGRKKQITAMQMLFDELGFELKGIEAMLRVTDFKAEYDFPRPGADNRRRARLRRAVERAIRAERPEDRVLSEVA